MNRLFKSKIIHIIGRVDPDIISFRAYVPIAVCIRPATLKDEVAEETAEMSEVGLLAGTSGDYDLDVDVIRNDNNQLQELNSDVSRIEGVILTKTKISSQVYKSLEPDLKLLHS